MRSEKLLGQEIVRIEQYWRDSQGLAYRQRHLLPLDAKLDEVRRTIEQFNRQRPRRPTR